MVTTKENKGLPESILIQLQKIVGASHVQHSLEDCRLESKVTIPKSKLCAAVVHPKSSEEVQKIVSLANENSLAIWTFSRGNNWGYGSHSAISEGAIILILDRMNRIIELNEELAFVVIEPGVTQKQLNDYLKEAGDRLWMDCTDSTPLGSVIGNAVERGVGYTPYGDHFANICGLEVVLPNAKILKTGGPKNCHTQYTHKWGVGPYIEGLFSQSNMGIVTRAGIWLMPKPEAFNFFSCELSSDSDLPLLIDSVRELALERVISSVHCFNPFLVLSSRIPYPYELRKEGQNCLEDAQIEKIANQKGIAPWTMICGLYGTASQVKVSRKRVKSKLNKFSRIIFIDDFKLKIINKLLLLLSYFKRHAFIYRFIDKYILSALPSGTIEILNTLPKVYGYHKGEPREYIVKSSYFKSGEIPKEGFVNPPKEGCGIKWLAPIVPASSTHVLKMRKAIEELFKQHHFEFPLSIIMLNPRTLILALPLFFNQEDPEEKSRVDLLYYDLVQLIKESGYQQYRTGIDGIDSVLEGNPELKEFLGQIKGSVDVNQILSSGSYGVKS